MKIGPINAFLNDTDEDSPNIFKSLSALEYYALAQEEEIWVAPTKKPLWMTPKKSDDSTRNASENTPKLK